MPRSLLAPLGVLIAVHTAAAQAPADSTRAPTAVNASFDLTWQAVRDAVRGDLDNDALLVATEGPGMRRGQWLIRIPVGDFRAQAWGACRTSTGSTISPRGGLAEVVVQGDSVAANVRVRVQWQGDDPSTQTQAPCRTLGEYEKQFEQSVRKKAEKAASRH